MKIETKTLSGACQRILPLATTKGLGSLGHIRIESVKGELSLVADSSEAREEVSVECEGELEPVCVPAKVFTQLVQAGNAHVELLAGPSLLEIRSGWKSMLPTMPLTEFPAAQADKLTAIGVNCSDLADGIEAVSFAAMTSREARARNRPTFDSVCVHLTGESILCSSHGFGSGALFDRAAICAELDDFLIPEAHCASLVSALRKPESVVLTSNSHISVAHSAGSFKVRTYEADSFPDMFEAMKRYPDTEPVATMDREQFLIHCQNCDVIDPEKFNPEGGAVTLEFRDNRLTISARSKAQSSYSAEMDVKTTKNMRVCFATKYLVPALKACTSDLVGWMQDDELSPAHFKYGDCHVFMMGMRVQ